MGQRRILRARQLERWEESLDEAETMGATLRFPMSLVRATDFFLLGSLLPYETLRNSGRLKMLDTIQHLKTFKMDHVVVFLSHQWLALQEPDPSGVHYQTMCAALRAVVALGTGDKTGDLDTLYVWVDFCSIPQEHLASQELAFMSNPLYSSLSDIFIIVAPSTKHKDLDMWCDVSTFSADGWCRAHMMAKVGSTELSGIFLCTSLTGELQEVTMETFCQLSIFIFEGDFRCCSKKHVGCLRCERQFLMSPILGIYANCVQSRAEGFETDKDDVLPSMLMSLISSDMERMFPKYFDFVREDPKDMITNVERRELFGPLPKMMENRLRTGRRKSENDVVEFFGPDRLKTRSHSFLRARSSSEEPSEEASHQSRLTGEEGDVSESDVSLSRSI